MNTYNTRPSPRRRVGLRAKMLAITLAITFPAAGMVTTPAASARPAPPAIGATAAMSSGPTRACQSLVEVSQPGTIYTSATRIAATNTAPSHCRVELTVESAIKIAVALPDDWSGRFQGVGGHGYSGIFESLDDAVSNGYAAATTDTGHSADELPLATFALDENHDLNWELIEDFASRSLHEMTLKGQALTVAYYGRGADFSYWNGCSTGGRQALMEAQRFPDDYDGILAGAPAINWNKLVPGWLWPQVAMKEIVGDVIPACKFDLVNNAAVAQCDSIDGVTDGVIGDPRQCDFDPATLVGQTTACGVFTEEDSRAIQSIWDGPTSADGSSLWYGYTPGSDISGLVAEEAHPFVTSFVANWVKQDPEWDWKTLDYAGFEEIFAEANLQFNDVIGTDDADLSAFADSGGKVLLWHGWSDRSFPPAGTIDYYEEVVAELGKGQAGRTAQLFMAPGVSHCGGGAGPDSFDMLGSLVKWVETDKTPKQIVASKVIAGETVQTRPLCSYPLVAQYSGHGSTDNATSFKCKKDYAPVGPRR